MCCCVSVFVCSPHSPSGELRAAGNHRFPIRAGDIPTRNILARVDFDRVDEQATTEAKARERLVQNCVYTLDSRPLQQLQDALKDKVFQLIGKSYEEVDKELWSEFVPPEESNSNEQPELDTGDLERMAALMSSLGAQGVGPPLNVGPGEPTAREWRKRLQFERFKQALADDPKLDDFVSAVKRSMSEFIDQGLLDRVQHDFEAGNQRQILIYRGENFYELVQVDKVRMGQAVPKIKENLEEQLKSRELAAHIFTWLEPNLPEKGTLTYDKTLTQDKTDEKISQMRPLTVKYLANSGVLAEAGQVVTPNDLALLREEHDQFVSELSPQRLLYFSLSKFGMYVALYTLCGFYIYFRRRPLLREIGSLAKLLLVVFVTIAFSWLAAPYRFELIPLVLFSMTAVILYKQELALLLSAVVALLIVLSLGHGLMDLVTLLASMSTAVLLLRHVRSRSKLIYVGLLTGGATVLTAIGVGTLSHFINIAGVPATETLQLDRAPAVALLYNSLWLGGCAVAAGLLMSGLLPFIERFFNVQTDLSLLELGDPAHPLLQELVRRAPGTYNHSINVASIAQAAAESIGANGLLVRVGAYFHDIGKMLKPGYFVENQHGDDNCHESLLPAMSTLVIIAHVKDGADLARQHNLPDAIIDFIQQHHGTTLVEYFYRRANEQRESDPEAASVDEGSYRYPGPRPQTREAAVLMLADAVESAARTLVDPAPARIESLVDEIAMKRLLDGQFDECGLTLRELHTIQKSLVKSLAAVYHGRIKYQEQTA